MNYDSGYHLLFSNPKLVEDLIENFVPETWVKQLDFSTLQRVNAKFHTDGLKRREGDIIYRVCHQCFRWCCIMATHHRMPLST